MLKIIKSFILVYLFIFFLEKTLHFSFSTKSSYFIYNGIVNIFYVF